ncbi:MAG: nucleoside triphosphate pyrophosphohydrolase [Woeseia sp.]
MSSIENLLEIMASLRNPQTGCPWDREQDFASIAPYTVEEAYEVADAIARDDLPALRDELGDLLFQVVFHAQMAAEVGAFDFDTVARAICDKMVRRHPHVFGSEAERARGAEPGSWERIKASEKQSGADDSALDGVANSLPALRRAAKLGRRAATTGFDWPDADGVRRKIDEELRELDAAQQGAAKDRVSEELGDLLFAIVNLARHLGIDAEQALVRANSKFERRFRQMEADVRDSGASLTDFDIDSLEAMWQAAKTRASGRADS